MLRFVSLRSLNDRAPTPAPVNDRTPAPRPTGLF